MKKLLFFLACFICSMGVSQSQNSMNASPSDTANYPYWIEMMQNPSMNFFKIQRAFNTYWNGRKITKGCGWKPFKRWEYMMLSRINPDGTMPSPDATYQAFMEYKKNIRSSNGNWISLGPSDIPSPGPAGYEGLGRINTVAFHPTDPMKIYIGAPAGGMWQSTDGGDTWSSDTDSLPTLGVSSIIIDRVNPNIILLGTGDRDAGDAAGLGVFRSTNGGQTWAAWNTGMGNRTVGRMIQHPTNNLIILAATSGGVYRTTDGGATWTQSINGDFKDVAFKPNDPSTVYATAGANFYKSTNNGTSFFQVTSGLSGGQRATIAVTAANPNYIYLLVSGNDSGLKGVYRSTDSGTTFTTRCTSPNILDWSCDGSGSGGQGWYDLAIAASPTNAEEIFVGGVNVQRSVDGGLTWTINSHWYGGCGVPAVHADCHFLGYNAVDGKLYAGNDGGVYVTGDHGTTWTDRTVGITIGQIYKLGQAATDRSKVINGFQDNGTYTHTGTGWIATGGGDGMECAIDYTNPAYTYHTVYYGDIFRKLNNTNEKKIAGVGTYGITESGGWVTPFMLHRTDPNTMFVGYKNVWRCNTIKANGSLTWTQISNNLGGSNGVDLVVLEQSKADVNILYAARGDNKLFRSDNCNDANPSWIDITSYLPNSYTITDMESHPSDPNTLYMTMASFVYKSTDKGMTWTNINDNLAGFHLNAIAYYKNAPEGLYVGSDAGVYYKDQTTAGWIPFSTGLPVNGRVTELEIYYDNDSVSRDAIAGSTYGRGLWQSDMFHTLPVADFATDHTTIPVGCAINFEDLSTGVPTNWKWTFTGAIPATSTEKNPANILYLNPGTYAVKMKIWNEYGADSIEKTNYITVSGTLIPNVNFTADKNALCSGDIVHFHDASENCPTSWSWTFNPNTVTFLDGTTETSQNPVVQFNEIKGYDVTLTVWNGVGSNQLTKQGYILQGGYTLPFTEEFENGLSTKYWQIVNPDGGITWDTISVGGTTPGHISAWLNHFNYPSVNKRDQLISPPMNFANYQTVTLSFKHAYAQRATIKDSLIVSISADCGTSWTRILAAGPNSSQPNVFATHAPMMESFYPQTSEDWCGSSYGTSCYALDLSPWAGLSNIKLMFESFNRNGNNQFIDNIDVSGPVGIVSQKSNVETMNIFPNPTSGEFTFIAKHVEGTIAISITNLQGSLILSDKIQSAHGQAIKKVNLSGLAKGVYYLKMTTQTGTQVEKIILN